MNSINKFLLQLVGITFVFYYGFYPLLGFKVWIKYSGFHPLSTEMSLINILIGLGVFTFVFVKNKNKTFEYTKCKKCKTSYNYSDLKDGICPKCNIKTIEMEEYYKKYPKELEDI